MAVVGQSVLLQGVVASSSRAAVHLAAAAAACQVRVAEQEGIVFIDEIDKIVNPRGMIRHGTPMLTC
jgi:ATP-dependent protease HslVU (ClpYQ) ATPase subunit